MPEQSFLGGTFLKWKWFTILDGDFEIIFNLRYGKVLLMAFCSHFLISNDFLPRIGKTQTNFFFGTTLRFGCSINTFSKYLITKVHLGLAAIQKF